MLPHAARLPTPHTYTARALRSTCFSVSASVICLPCKVCARSSPLASCPRISSPARDTVRDADVSAASDATRHRGDASASMTLQLLQLLTASIVLPPAPLVIVGPGCQSTQLLTAKLAAARGHRVQVVARTVDVQPSNRLMYGTSEPPEFRPLFSCQNSQIASALGAAEGMILSVAGGKAPPTTSGIGTMMPYMPRVRRIVLLSAIGGSTGNTGGLGEGELIMRCEEEAATIGQLTQHPALAQ